MNYLKQAPSFLLAIVFVVFGANYFFNFMPMPATTGNVKAFFDLFYPTKYLLVVKILEVVVGLLLFIKPLRALGLLLLAPIVVNILLFELLIAQAPGIGVLLLLLNGIAIYQHKEKYIGIIK
jgi:hypothetical protein